VAPVAGAAALTAGTVPRAAPAADSLAVGRPAAPQMRAGSPGAAIPDREPPPALAPAPAPDRTPARPVAAIGLAPTGASEGGAWSAPAPGLRAFAAACSAGQTAAAAVGTVAPAPGDQPWGVPATAEWFSLATPRQSTGAATGPRAGRPADGEGHWETCLWAPGAEEDVYLPLDPDEALAALGMHRGRPAAWAATAAALRAPASAAVPAGGVTRKLGVCAAPGSAPLPETLRHGVGCGPKLLWSQRRRASATLNPIISWTGHAPRAACSPPPRGRAGAALRAPERPAAWAWRDGRDHPGVGARRDTQRSPGTQCLGGPAAGHAACPRSRRDPGAAVTGRLGQTPCECNSVVCGKVTLGGRRGQGPDKLQVHAKGCDHWLGPDKLQDKWQTAVMKMV